MRRLVSFIAVLALLLGCLSGSCALAEQVGSSNESGWNNYILVIDNSKSTTNKTVLGPATDPDGMRFSAASAVYEKINEDNSRIGVIVFCGKDACSVYGPFDRNSPYVEEQVGAYLKESKNTKRDKFTDITNALDQALSVMDKFPDGQTNVILLTDGVNDLTDSGHPFDDAQNMQANDETVRRIQQINDRGAKFCVVALTSGGESENRDRFMEFINRMGEAGGGNYDGAAGRYDNVLEATDSGLITALLQMLGISEGSATEIFGGMTPVSKDFHVPYASITELSITVSFMPKDLPRLDEMRLTDPNGTEYVVWKGGQADPPSNITVRENNGYVMMKIASPMVGDWNILVTGKDDASNEGKVSGVDIQAAISFNQNVRLMLTPDKQPVLGEEVQFTGWLQTYENGQFQDIEDDAFYSQSSATLTLKAPGGSDYQTFAMDRQGNRFVKTMQFDQVGNWNAQLTVSNDILDKRLDNYSFIVAEPVPTPAPTEEPTQAPTDTPVPTPTPEPTAAPVGAISIEVSPTYDAGEPTTYIDRNSDSVQLHWSVEGGYESAQANLYEGDAAAPLLSDLPQDSFVERSMLEQDTDYTLRVSVVPLYGSEADAATAEQSFRIYPEPAVLANFALGVDDANAADGTFRTKSDVAKLKWNIDGDVDHFELSVAGPDGANVATETLPGDKREYKFDMDRDGEYRATLSAVPRYSIGGEGAQSAEAAIVPHIPSFLEKYMIPIIIGAALLILLAILIPVLISALTPKMKGELVVDCYDLGFSQTFTFGKSRGTRLYRNKPLKNHPAMAKLKNEPIYKLLGDLVLSMDQTNSEGFIAADSKRKQHIENQDAICITYQDPMSGQSRSIYIVSGDTQPEVIRLKDEEEVLHEVRFSSENSDFGGSW